VNVDFDGAALRQRADQCRHLAGGVRDKTIRDRLLTLASDYDALARHAENTPLRLAERIANQKRS